MNVRTIERATKELNERLGVVTLEIMKLLYEYIEEEKVFELIDKLKWRLYDKF